MSLKNYIILKKVCEFEKNNPELKKNCTFGKKNVRGFEETLRVLKSSLRKFKKKLRNLEKSSLISKNHEFEKISGVSWIKKKFTDLKNSS